MDELTIKLPINDWNEILSVLGTGAYVKVAPLIQRITQQAQQQSAAQTPAAPPMPMNGPAAQEQPSGPGRMGRRDRDHADSA